MICFRDDFTVRPIRPTIEAHISFYETVHCIARLNGCAVNISMQIYVRWVVRQCVQLTTASMQPGKLLVLRLSRAARSCAEAVDKSDAWTRLYMYLSIVHHAGECWMKHDRNTRISSFYIESMDHIAVSGT